MMWRGHEEGDVAEWRSHEAVGGVEERSDETRLKTM
jgi:hypothetical protein